jgi:hypothetical protein
MQIKPQSAIYKADQEMVEHSVNVLHMKLLEETIPKSSIASVAAYDDTNLPADAEPTTWLTKSTQSSRDRRSLLSRVARRFLPAYRRSASTDAGGEDVRTVLMAFDVKEDDLCGCLESVPSKVLSPSDGPIQILRHGRDRQLQLTILTAPGTPGNPER